MTSRCLKFSLSTRHCCKKYPKNPKITPKNGKNGIFTEGHMPLSGMWNRKSTCSKTGFGRSGICYHIQACHFPKSQKSPKIDEKSMKNRGPIFRFLKSPKMVFVVGPLYSAARHENPQVCQNSQKSQKIVEKNHRKIIKKYHEKSHKHL